MGWERVEDGKGRTAEERVREGGGGDGGYPDSR